MIKTLMITLLITTSAVAAQNNIPKRVLNGYSNPAQEEGYSYDVNPGEKIWTQFGRPYWKSNTKKTVKSVVMNKTVKTIKNKVFKKQTINLDIRFASNTAKFDQSYTQDLDKVAKMMKLNKDIMIEVRGHTDSTGNIKLNRNLSFNRADAIKKYLVKKHGISLERLKASGYGSKQPLADNDTEVGKQLNRRVEAIIISQ